MTWRAATWMLGVMLLAVVGCTCGWREQSAGKDSVFLTLSTRKQIDGLNREQLAGKQLYLHYCAVCHAETGRGDGFNAFNLKDSFGITPANLTATESELSLDRLKQIISQGGASAGKSKYMPNWGGVLEESRIHALARYVQSLREPEGAAPAALK